MWSCAILATHRAVGPCVPAAACTAIRDLRCPVLHAAPHLRPAGHCHAARVCTPPARAPHLMAAVKPRAPHLPTGAPACARVYTNCASAPLPFPPTSTLAHPPALKPAPPRGRPPTHLLALWAGVLQLHRLAVVRRDVPPVPHTLVQTLQAACNAHTTQQRERIACKTWARIKAHCLHAYMQ